MTERAHNIGLVGTGFVAKGFANLVANSHPQYRIVSVLTRRRLADIGDFPLADALTGSLDALIDRSELIVECSGDPIHATVVIERALEAQRPVVTMNSEFHVTTGSWFVGRGLVTEAEGDQPGCLAALHEEAVAMGFKPLVYGNMKGFLQHDPRLDDMRYWADRQGFSLGQTTSFTDGTKLQIEQALVANGVGARLLKRGMLGVRTDSTEQGARALAVQAASLGEPIADFVLSSHQPAGVFIAATHDREQHLTLRNLKMGEGPYYLLQRNYHLCALEIAKTVRRVFAGGGVLLDNSPRPTLSVVAIAKRCLSAGHLIEQAIGGFDLRGEAARIDAFPDHVPIGVLKGAVLRCSVDAGQILAWDDVELAESRAVEIARAILTTPGDGRWGA